MTLTEPNPNPPADNVPASAPRAGIYLRESALEAAAPDRYGIPVQRDQCIAHCTARGYAVAQEYLDAGADSAELERPQLSRLRQDIHDGGLDVVVVARFDRLARDQGLANFLLYEASKIYDVAVEFADPSEQFEDTPQGTLFRNVKAFANEIRRQEIRQSTQNARQKRVSEGKLIPGKRPSYGYQWRDTLKTAWDEHPDTAPIMRRAYRDVLAGVSLRQLAKALTDEGVPLPSGILGAWSTSTLSRLLRRTCYKGEYDANHTAHSKKRRLLPNGTPKTSYVTRERAADDPRRVRMPAGVVPALVDATTWQQVQAILRSNKDAAPRHNTDPEATLLRGGLVVCGYCGRPMHSHRRAKPKTGPGSEPDAPRVWEYACQHDFRDGVCPGGQQVIMAAALDRQVWQCFTAYLTEPERLHRLFDEWEAQAAKQPNSGERDVLNLAKRAHELDGQIERLAERIRRAPDADVADVYEGELARAVAERKSVRALQDAAQRLYTERQARLAQRTEYADFARQVGAECRNPAVEYAFRRGMLDAWEVRVVVWHKSHTPRWAMVVGFQTVVDTALAHPGTPSEPLMVLTAERVLPPAEAHALVADLRPVLDAEFRRRLRLYGPQAVSIARPSAH